MKGRVTGANTPAAIWKTYMTSALKRIQVSAIPEGPPPSALTPVAEDALRDLLGTQADAVAASQSANDNGQNGGQGLPPIVTMKPIPNPEVKKTDSSLDDLFSEAQKKNQ
jgi:penicillin-binding protein 1A